MGDCLATGLQRLDIDQYGGAFLCESSLWRLTTQTGATAA
ncbi:protein of unknown function [Paraburkholderia kururiensis]